MLVLFKDTGFETVRMQEENFETLNSVIWEEGTEVLQRILLGSRRIFIEVGKGIRKKWMRNKTKEKGGEKRNYIEYKKKRWKLKGEKLKGRREKNKYKKKT